MKLIEGAVQDADGNVIAVPCSYSFGFTTLGGDWDYTYIVTAGKAEITKYTGVGGAVTVPSTLGGFPVTSIGKEAFGYCSGLTSISIPQGVTSIGDRAFSNCTGLTSISIPQGVTSIGDYAFSNCTGLTSISIPQRVTTIGDRVFYSCTRT